MTNQPKASCKKYFWSWDVPDWAGFDDNLRLFSARVCVWGKLGRYPSCDCFWGHCGAYRAHPITNANRGCNRELWGIILESQPPHTRQKHEQRYGRKCRSPFLFEAILAMFYQIFVHVFALYVGGLGSWRTSEDCQSLASNRNLGPNRWASIANRGLMAH